MLSQMRKNMAMALTLLAVALVSVSVAAQEAKPASKAALPGAVSRWDIFAGYSYLAPNASVSNIVQSSGQAPSTVQYTDADWGSIFSVARFFNRHLGVQVELAEHDLTVDAPSSNSSFLTLHGGVLYRFPKGNITPFVHALAGGTLVGGPYHEPRTWGFGGTIGGGVDYETPLLNHRLAVRLFQADYTPGHADFGSGSTQGTADFDHPVRLSAGLVLHTGSIEPPPAVAISVNVAPAAVFPGEAVTATATAANVNPKLHQVYSWDGKGLTANGTSGTIATADLAPGTYSVKVGIKEGKPGKEGLKPGSSAQAEASFTVKEFEPPTLSITAAPTTLKPGDKATITATGVSPQGRPLTYTYVASAGSVNPNGNTAVYDTTGAPTGAVTITGTANDDKGHSATATTQVNILPPYIPPVLHTQPLSPVGFELGGKHPKSSARVNNEVKAVLDGLALTLGKQPDTKLVVVGNSTTAEKAEAEKLAKKSHKKNVQPENLAAQRAVNVKDYLVREKGIDPSRIQAGEGNGDEQKVDLYLVPAGANFNNDVHGVKPVDEAAVKPQIRKPLPVRKHAAAKKGAKKAAGK